MREFEDSPLVKEAGDLWLRATRAEFLNAIRDGTIPDDAFHRWLVQDYHFATGLTIFQAVALSKAPRPAHKLLIGGLSSLDGELDWFEQKAGEFGLDLESERHAVCRRYVDYLIASAYSQPFEVLVAILFGVEAAYLAAWSRLESTGPHAEFIDRWSNEAFAGYVRGLQDLAARYRHPDQQSEFNAVLEHERDFWCMTWGD